MKGDTLQLSATVDPSDITPSWSSSDNSIATVTNTGLVTGLTEGTVTIKARVGSKKSTVEFTVTPKVYKDGEAVYFNVTTGKVCLATEAVSTTDTKSGCMKFYTFGDKSGSATVNMILDHNTTATKVLWSSGSNSSGPTTAYTQLKNDTNSWIGVEKQENYYFTSSSINYVIIYATDNAKARFITANEIANITGNTSFNSSTATSSNDFYFDTNTKTEPSQYSSKYAWLYDNFSSCSSKGCLSEAPQSLYVYSYYTSDAVVGTSDQNWDVRIGYIYSLYTNNRGDTGIRPVITVLKANLYK